ncbi:ABC-2 type transporter-domain-containing protein [Suillus ampliporus]|nr:ABC-2 type transporter-domain-containing protein [Suillus ampliporus]
MGVQCLDEVGAGFSRGLWVWLGMFEENEDTLGPTQSQCVMRLCIMKKSTVLSVYSDVFYIVVDAGVGHKLINFAARVQCQKNVFFVRLSLMINEAFLKPIRIIAGIVIYGMSDVHWSAPGHCTRTFNIWMFIFIKIQTLQAVTPVHNLPSDLIDSDTLFTPSLLKKSSNISTSIKNEQDFDFEYVLRDLMKRRHDEGIKDRHLGVMFKDLRVIGAGSRTSIQPTVGDPFNPSTILRKISQRRHPSTKHILSGFEGVVAPGEMLLVLGRPGSGCSTLLKTLANQRGEYHAVEGQTREDYVEDTTTMLMKVFGLYRSKDTLVGNAQIQGVSGGERKRVSIAETLGSGGSLGAWDNPTRGLDSSTALEFVRTLRAITDVRRTTAIVSLYQAGEQLYDLFDKVCVIDEGRMAYFGSAKSAKDYFIDMGFRPQSGQTTPDFLVAVTDPNGRKIRPGYESLVPRTSDEFASRFIDSDLGRQNQKTIEHHREHCVGNDEQKQAYLSSVAAERAGTSTAYMTSIPQQVKAVMKRRLQVIAGNKFELIVQLASQIFQAIIIGTVFLSVPNDTSAYFSRESVLFLSPWALLPASNHTSPPESGVTLPFHPEPRAYCGRYSDHVDRSTGFCCHIVPAGWVATFCRTVFASNFNRSLLGFILMLLHNSIFYLFIFIMSQTTKSFFRAIAASFKSRAGAMAVSGISVLLMSLYSGYTVPWPTAPMGLRWIMWLNPLWWGFGGLMVNEFHTLDGVCSTLVPQGPGYENVSLENQVCTTVGSQSGQLLVDANIYVGLTFDFWYDHLWRNFGVMCAFYIGFLVVLLVATECNTSSAFDGTVVLFKQGSSAIDMNAKVVDEEKADAEIRSGSRSEAADPSTFNNLEKETTTMDLFTWQHLHYEVPIEGGMKRLLDDTTLLNVLAQRVGAGVITGDRLVNGQPLPIDFQAQMRQLDTHLPEATVREALLFSANLRQPQSVPLAEKEAYVDKCLRMCGLEEYADAVVGSLGVEHRKRTTIAVELAAKPKLLLFLDEPTSGLDSQSAWAIVQFLRWTDRVLRRHRRELVDPSETISSTMVHHAAALMQTRAGATAFSTTDWYDVWKHSSEAEQLQVQIDKMHEDGRARPQQISVRHSAFATSWSHQFIALAQTELSKHTGAILRTSAPSFTFFQARDSLQGTQDKLFSIFLSLVLCIPLVHQLMAVYIDIRMVYEIRERSSRMYDWTALVMSQLAAELPWNMTSSAMFFFCWFWTVGYPTDRAGYTFLIFFVAFPFYYTTLGLAIASMAPSAPVASLYWTTLVIFITIFDGVIQPFVELNWWRWMYRVSPFTYVIEGLLVKVSIGGSTISCSSTELVSVNPPNGLTCGKYMGPFMEFAGGYLTNPNATEGCQYCPYTTANQYMYSRFNIQYSDHWRNLGIVFGFVAFNIIAIFWFTYFMRIRTVSVFASLKQKLSRGE